MEYRIDMGVNFLALIEHHMMSDFNTFAIVRGMYMEPCHNTLRSQIKFKTCHRHEFVQNQQRSPELLISHSL